MTTSEQELDERLRRVEARTAIEELVTRYAMAFDDRDLDLLGECFTTDGAFVSVGGRVQGRAALMEYYSERLRQYGPSYHVPHRLVLDELTDDAARGVVLAHSELMVDGGLFLAAHRYRDLYRFENARWRIAERAVEFLYGAPMRDLLHLDPASPRRRWPGAEPVEADIPESLPTWKAFYQR
ncbi:nuclear transport factor 2 family protein [Prauserella flavalba]|uniref:nuclear transport factor 2 family protein n=1 Tax=Prauserella flavalba TaxID=1477506 RepID=UPI0036E5D826